MRYSKRVISASGIHEQLTLLDNLPGMAYRRRNAPDWPMLLVTEGSIELTGYSPDALLGGRPQWRDLIHPEDRETVWRLVQDAVENERRFEIQYRLATRDKQYKWVWERGSTLNAGEQGILIEGFVTDISPLREKELELERSEAFAAAIVEGAAEGIALINADYRVEALNKAAAQMFGMSSADAIGTGIRDLVSRKSYADLLGEFRKYRASGHADLFDGGLEITGRRADSSEFPMQLNVMELSVECEHRYTVLIRDVSEQREKAEQIRQQNEWLNATVEYSPIGIIMADKDLRLVAVNSAFAGMLGYDVDTLIGRRISELTHPDDIEETETAASTSFGDGPDHYSYRKRYLHRDGHIVHAAVNIAVAHDRQGNAEFVVANVEDQTQRLDAESKLREQQDQLTRLERLSTLGEMMAGVAHEINQPLTAISTYAQSGLRFMDPKNPKPDRLRDALTKLSDQARRAGTVVERIRELARQDVSNNELLDVNRLIQQVCDLAAVDARPRGADTRLNLGQDLPLVWGDAIQIQQVLLNLIRNSIDSMEAATFSNGNEVVLRTSTTEDGMIVIAVVDCGLGVSEEAAADLFQPFSTHKRAGLGLGLSISRSIVTAHGGQLDYHNNPEAGATFVLTLPQASGDIIREI